VIEVLTPGAWTTIQDRGRPGWERFGISPGGPADWFSAAVANRLVGNGGDAAMIECTLVGPTLRFHRPATIAMTGGTSSAIENWTVQHVEAEAELKIGRIQPGLRTYLAVGGGIDVPEVMGSRALCQHGRFGGGFGRPLQEGDRLPISADSLSPAHVRGLMGRWPAAHRLPLLGPWEIRVIAGPHSEAFADGDLERFFNTALVVTPRADRMGMRLQAPGLRLHGSEILTAPVTQGAIQVTPSGEVIVLLAEHQTTGGYPVIATVISADWPLMGQARPGDTIHFRSVSLSEARRARVRLAQWLSPGG